MEKAQKFVRSPVAVWRFYKGLTTLKFELPYLELGKGTVTGLREFSMLSCMCQNLNEVHFIIYLFSAFSKVR